MLSKPRLDKASPLTTDFNKNNYDETNQLKDAEIKILRDKQKQNKPILDEYDLMVKRVKELESENVKLRAIQVKFDVINTKLVEGVKIIEGKGYEGIFDALKAAPDNTEQHDPDSMEYQIAEYEKRS